MIAKVLMRYDISITIHHTPLLVNDYGAEVFIPTDSTIEYLVFLILYHRFSDLSITNL